MSVFDFLRPQDKPAGESRSPRERELIQKLQARLAGDEAAQPLRYALRFTGQVQGVGFRWTNQGLAEQLGITGWVKNLEDGSVALEAQGTAAQLIRHLDSLHETYDRMRFRIWLEEVRELAPDTQEAGFSVRY